jgi:hypothetical protein
MAKHMVRECEYRNMCPEMKGCGYYALKKRKEFLVLDIDWIKRTHGINLSLPEIEILDEQINELNKQ